MCSLPRHAPESSHSAVGSQCIMLNIFQSKVARWKAGRKAGTRDLIIFATSNGTAAKRRASTESSAFNPRMIIGLSALLIALLGLSLIPVTIHTAKAQAAVANPSGGYVVTAFATGFPSSNNFCSFNGQGCGPLGLAFDASGNLFVVDINNGGLYKFPPTGGNASTH